MNKKQNFVISVKNANFARYKIMILWQQKAILT